jgi:hypothetical protein
VLRVQVDRFQDGLRQGRRRENSPRKTPTPTFDTLEQRSLLSTIVRGIGEFSGEYFGPNSAFPRSSVDVGSFDYGQELGGGRVSSATISGTFGNSVVGSTSGVDVFLDGVLIARAEPYGPAWNGGGSWSHTLTESELQVLQDGSAQLTAVQTNEFVIRLGATRLEMETGGLDLTSTSFGYRVPADATGQLNGPVAANAPYIVTATIKNQGQGSAGTFTATVYLSSDTVIDPQRDIPLQTTTVTGLAPGASTTITINMSPPSTWPAALPPWSGVVTVGLVIDPQQLLSDDDFTNNQNVGVGIDTRPLQLYDGIPPTSIPATGLSYRGALLWMVQNGFTPVPPGTGSGWSKHLSSSLNIRSAFDGQIRSGLAYRQNAFIQPVAGGTYRIFLQGNAFFAEPNPETAILYGLTWFNYVADWHPRY